MSKKKKKKRLASELFTLGYRTCPNEDCDVVVSKILSLREEFVLPAQSRSRRSLVTISVVKHPFLSQWMDFNSFHLCMTVVEEDLPVLHSLSSWLVQGKTLLPCWNRLCCFPKKHRGVAISPDLQYKWKMQNMSLSASFHLEYILQSTTRPYAQCAETIPQGVI